MNIEGLSTFSIELYKTLNESNPTWQDLFKLRSVSGSVREKQIEYDYP